MPSSFIRNPTGPDEDFKAQQELEFDRYRTAIKIVQRMREAGISCELSYGSNHPNPLVKGNPGTLPGALLAETSFVRRLELRPMSVRSRVIAWTTVIVGATTVVRATTVAVGIRLVIWLRTISVAVMTIIVRP